MKNICGSFFFLFLSLLSAKGNIPDTLLHHFFVADISFPYIGSCKPVVTYRSETEDILRINIVWQLPEDIVQDKVEVTVRPSFLPSFHWATHLTPQENYIIAQHVFRAPAMLGADHEKSMAIIPDLNVLQNTLSNNWYMDMNAPENAFNIGLANARVTEHILFQKEKETFYKKGRHELGFYILKKTFQKKSTTNPWRHLLAFMWQKWGQPLYEMGQPLKYDYLPQYVAQTYTWAFDTWKKSVWQEFEIKGESVGAPVFIVNVTQSPNFQGEINEREFRSIWNQAWFNSLRSASGLYRYARRTGNKQYQNYALKTKELALAFPQTNGFFPSVIATEMEEIEIEGKRYNRSLGWDTRYFANSNRNPFTSDPRSSPYHILDMSFTAYYMLSWYSNLEKDKRLLDYAIKYADALLGIQQKNGYFPAWLSLKDLTPLPALNNSAESAMSVTFLLKLYALTRNKEYFKAAEKALQAIITDIIPEGRWEDFETYWSCSRYGADSLIGHKVARNNMYKQNTLSMFWTAQALLEMFKITHNVQYLSHGQRTLDEMLMYQAVWQPPLFPLSVFGGFGVMNADAEWNDARQSLFAPLIAEYGQILHFSEYTHRGMSALKASFTMMYTPLNPKTFTQWNKRWPFFGREDYGFMMENYGHDGVTNREGLGIGEFTIYDWGNGAAAEAYNKILDERSRDKAQSILK